jgi:hypothetical protein
VTLSETRAAVPPGWDENPTSLRRRALLAALAVAGLLVAGYLTLYQWDAWPAWDPFFDATKVLDLTEPVPDALGGVAAYGTDLLLLALGAVLSIGAVVSIGLIIVQPTVAGTWCTLCLVSAALSLALFFLGIGEARAAWQHVRRARAQGIPLGDAVWGRAARASTPGT